MVGEINVTMILDLMYSESVQPNKFDIIFEVGTEIIHNNMTKIFVCFSLMKVLRQVENDLETDSCMISYFRRLI